jgi:hypothetical protein
MRREEEERYECTRRGEKSSQDNARQCVTEEVMLQKQ